MIYVILIILVISLATLYKLAPPQNKLIVAVTTIMIIGWWFLAFGKLI